MVLITSAVDSGSVLEFLQEVFAGIVEGRRRKSGGRRSRRRNLRRRRNRSRRRRRHRSCGGAGPENKFAMLRKANGVN